LVLLCFSSLLLPGLSVISALLSYIQVLIAARVGSSLSNRLRDRLFDHLQHLSLDWHGRQRTGDLVQRITGNILDVEKLVTDGLVDLLAGILTLVGILIVMLLLNWRFTVLCMVIVPALFFSVLRYTLAIKRANKVKAKAAAQVAEVATEDIGAITEVKAFTLEEREAEHFRRYSTRLWAASWRSGRLQAEFTPIVAILLALSSAPVAYTGPDRVHGDVVFRNVVFGYNEDQPVLTGIDLKVPSGRRVALVGLSGSGKTTLVKLIPRFYEVWDGSITVDGVDVRNYPLETLRRN